MTDKIKELAAQARKALAVDAMNGGEFNMQSYEEKFAELIVRECINLVENNDIVDWDRALPTAAKSIKEYFGVE